jgi:hypothetical protein
MITITLSIFVIFCWFIFIERTGIKLYVILKYFGTILFALLLLLDTTISSFKKTFEKDKYDDSYVISLIIIIIGFLLQIIHYQKNIRISFYFKIGDIFYCTKDLKNYKVKNIENGKIEFYSLVDSEIVILKFKEAINKLKHEVYIKQNSL